MAIHNFLILPLLTYIVFTYVVLLEYLDFRTSPPPRRQMQYEEVQKVKVKSETAQFYFLQLTITKQTMWTMSPQGTPQAQDEAQ